MVVPAAGLGFTPQELVAMGTLERRGVHRLPAIWARNRIRDRWLSHNRHPRLSDLAPVRRTTSRLNSVGPTDCLLLQCSETAAGLQFSRNCPSRHDLPPIAGTGWLVIDRTA